MTASTEQQRQDGGSLQGEAVYVWVYLLERKELHRFGRNLSTFSPEFDSKARSKWRKAEFKHVPRNKTKKRIPCIET